MGDPVQTQPTLKLVPISVAELNNTENEILKHVQRQFFKQKRQPLEQQIGKPPQADRMCLRTPAASLSLTQP